MAAPWRFYVYELVSAEGSVQYVGKGSGCRLRSQRGRFKLAGYEVARFKRENDAYKFERQRIAECKPPLNKHPGGNGSRAAPIRAPRKFAWEREIERMGTRRYVARYLLGLAYPWPPSKVEAFRQVLNGPRC